MRTELDHRGPAPAAGQFEGVDRLIWRTPTSQRADLTASGLQSVHVDAIDGPLTLHMPPTVAELSLSGELTAVRIEGLVAPDPLVHLRGDVSDGLPDGISRAARLEISDTADLDLSPLHEMTALRELTVRNVAGRVSNCAALAATGNLERIALFRCYDIDTAGFPHQTALPRLGWISVADISAAAKVLRSRIDGFWNGHVRLARSRARLEAHDDDPFRTWGDENPELGRRASALWRRAQVRLAVAATTPARAAAIRQLADDLDRAAGNQPLDTLRREQAGEAVRGLARRHLPAEHPLTLWEPT